MLDGVFVSLAVDSHIPVHSQSREPLFTKNYKSSIFPCLYEKLMAKIYGDYYSITSEFIDIVELQTFFCREEVSLTRGIHLQQLQQTIVSKLD
jgi:hypothetical protein